MSGNLKAAIAVVGIAAHAALHRRVAANRHWANRGYDRVLVTAAVAPKAEIRLPAISDELGHQMGTHAPQNIQCSGHDPIGAGTNGNRPKISGFCMPVYLAILPGPHALQKFAATFLRSRHARSPCATVFPGQSVREPAHEDANWIVSRGRGDSGSCSPRRCTAATCGAADRAREYRRTDLGGVVTGPNGPEAGVWVIAETTELPTKMAKIVVTDDQGRYVLPDLPKANYSVWVRGYGLVDSPKVQTAPGKILNLTAVPAPNEAAAAEYYPPIYWLSMAKMPDKSEFPGTGHDGNGINRNIKIAAPVPARVQDRRLLPLSCARHQGDAHDPGGVRHVQVRLRGLDTAHPVRPGQQGHGRDHRAVRHRARPEDLADWTDRIAAGEMPAPSRRARRASSATS